MIKAQEAYQQSVEHLQEVNVIDWLIRTENLIKHAVEEGSFATIVQPIEDLKIAEKIALQLESSYGYCTAVLPSGTPIINVEDKSFKQGWMLVVNWKQMPLNTRDGFTI